MKQYQSVSKWFIGGCVLSVVTGLVMCIWPNLTLDLLGKVLGIGMLVVGIAHVILYFTKEHQEGILHMDLTLGVILAAFGAFMLMHQDFVGMAIPFGIGILLLVGGITKIQYSIDMKRIHFVHWKIMLVIAIIMMVAGMVLIYNPFRENILIYFIGISLIADGIISITAVLMISRRMKNLAKGWIPKHMRQEAPAAATVPVPPTETVVVQDAQAVNTPAEYPAPYQSGMQVPDNGPQDPQ